jgi:hypothetical protein
MFELLRRALKPLTGTNSQMTSQNKCGVYGIQGIQGGSEIISRPRHLRVKLNRVNFR